MSFRSCPSATEHPRTERSDHEPCVGTGDQSYRPAGHYRGYLYSATGSEHTRKDGQDLVFVFKRSENDEETFANFVSASMDGRIMPEGSHTTAPGSQILTLKAEYLDTLSEGEHTLRVDFKDGFAECKFLIKAAAAPTAAPTATPKPKPIPKTGDSADVALWLGLVALGMIGIGATVGIRRKRKTGR